MLAIILQAMGLITVAVGAGIWFLPAGFIVMGLGMTVMGVAIERADK